MANVTAMSGEGDAGMEERYEIRTKAAADNDAERRFLRRRLAETLGGATIAR